MNRQEFIVKIGSPKIGSFQASLLRLLLDTSRQMDACPKCLILVEASLKCLKCGEGIETIMPETTPVTNEVFSPPPNNKDYSYYPPELKTAQVRPGNSTRW